MLFRWDVECEVKGEHLTDAYGWCVAQKASDSLDT
jgi:hypothetical protein